MALADEIVGASSVFLGYYLVGSLYAPPSIGLSYQPDEAFRYRMTAAYLRHSDHQDWVRTEYLTSEITIGIEYTEWSYVDPTVSLMWNETEGKSRRAS
jgi:hypothetical protein